MAPSRFAPSPAYLAVAQGIRELHQLTLEGRDESPEADRVRDAIDGPWEKLSEVERKLISGLSEDLYSISDAPDEGLKATDCQAQGWVNASREISSRDNFDQQLEGLRQFGHLVSRAQLSYERGLIWLHAGDTASAILFLEHAVSLEPDNTNYHVLLQDVQGKVGPAAARR